MRRFYGGLLTAVLILSNVSAAQAAITLYSEDFETDPAANWTTNSSGLSDILVDFHYDYSAIGVPNAPGGATSRGLKMTANNSGGVFSGFSVSPTGKSFTGSYTVSFNLWQNYVGPLNVGGSGTTQLSSYGIGTTGTSANWPGAAGQQYVGFMHTLDGGSSVDYRVYTSTATSGATPTTDGVSYTAGTHATARNGSDPHYSGFGGEAAPAAQLALYPGQTDVTAAGVAAFAWRNVVIDVVENIPNNTKIATWTIDGLQIAQVDLTKMTLAGDNIFFGHSDSNNPSSTDPNRTNLNVTLIDNIRVTAVPEPSALSLGLFGAALTLVGRRRKLAN